MMKYKSYIILVIISVLFNNCSKKDDVYMLEPEISFVLSDGSRVFDELCLDPDKDYAIEITVRSGNEKDFPRNFDFALNGATFNVKFNRVGTKRIPVVLIKGKNTVRLIESGISSSIDVVFCNATILADAISFVFADGSEIPTGECLDLNAEYAVKIKTIVEGTGPIESTQIEYTINGVNHSTTFTGSGTQVISVSLKAGENTAQLSEAGISTKLDLVASCNAVLFATSISFVHEDGSELADGSCLDMNAKYAVKIQTEVEGDGSVEPTKIEYTINGILYIMQFSQSGSKVNQVSINEGQNIAQVLGTNLESKINFVTQGDFELVE